MGTTYSITSDIAITQTEIDAELQAVNALFSNWQADSEVNTVNALALNTPLTISPEFGELLTLSQDIHTQTSGYFDVTMGSVIDAWGFGAIQVTGKPTDKQISELLSHAGHQHITLEGNTLIKAKNTQLNFSAIAKGYGVDAIADLLIEKGSTDFVVEIGGEVRVGGTKRIGIERIDHPPYPIMLTNEAIATSGDYRNVREFGTASFMHILDPFTGKPSVSNLMSVSVIHASATMADAYATALLAMGREKAVVFIQKNNLKSILIDTTNTLTTYHID